MTTTLSTTVTSTGRAARRSRRARAVLAPLAICLGATAVIGLPAAAWADDGPAVPVDFEGPGTTMPPPQPPDPEVNPAVDPDIDDLAPETIPPEPPFPPDPEVNPDLEPGADDFAPETIPPEPPLPPQPPVDGPDEVIPPPDVDCDPFDPADVMGSWLDSVTTATVQLYFPSEEQADTCVTPIVVATYALDEPDLGGTADLVDFEVISSEDLKAYPETNEPATVELDLEGCYHAIVGFHGVGIPLDLDGVALPPHFLYMTTGEGQGWNCDTDDTDDGTGEGETDDGQTGDDGENDGTGQSGWGRLPSTGGDLLPMVGAAAALATTGLLVIGLARRRSHQPA